MIICIILSSLALTAAMVCMTVVVREGKRNRERNEASIQELDARWKQHQLESHKAWTNQLKKQGLATEEALRKVQGRVEELERGTVPDYEKAKAAAKAVDDFHEGLTNILNFDPYEAVRAGRGGGEAG